MPPSAPWLTVPDVCRELGIQNVHTVLNLVKAGKLAAINISSGAKRPTYRIPRTELDKWIAARWVTALPRSNRRRMKRDKMAGVPKVCRD
jgi:excisionase family DNA binding protein